MLRSIGYPLALVISLGCAGCGPLIITDTVSVAGVGPVEIDRIQVQVVSISPEERLATVRQGRYTWQVFVPPVFGNLRNVRPGDRLQISRIEGVALSVERARKGASAGITYNAFVSDGYFQNLPDKFVARSLTLTARIEQFDPNAGIVSYLGPSGLRKTRVIDPALRNAFAQFRRGDLVELTFSEAVYIEHI
ncbi:hypothetical protein [Bosea sp. Leaf344]|uniref:hypothetical protein n=1 Tax=Bosea sp. Leaf344 TaxID=1736346 RepID=UPI00138F4B40|nr:hypothetical protein [Bosea sp. Leaf344]